jgi:thiamine pyrophosphokinase
MLDGWLEPGVLKSRLYRIKQLLLPIVKNHHRFEGRDMEEISAVEVADEVASKLRNLEWTVENLEGQLEDARRRSSDGYRL